MENINITKIKKEDFEQLFTLMCASFPPEEYRPREKQFALLDDKNYCASVLKKDGKVDAFIAVWYLKGFTFAEHFAVSPERRNNGIGSAFLKEYLKTLCTPLVLEVENDSNEISKRRVQFYKRIGFAETGICYDQPNFHKSNKRIPLRILYHPNGFDLDLTKVKQEIFTKIYKQNIKQDGEII